MAETNGGADGKTPTTFADLDSDCKLEILKHLDSFHSLQVLIEACPRLYTLLQANLLGIYRRILANSFELDPYDLVYLAAGSPDIIEDAGKWRERRRNKAQKYGWPGFTMEYPNDGSHPCLWLVDSSDYEYDSVGGYSKYDNESEWNESESEFEEDAGCMSNPEGEDEEDENEDASDRDGAEGGAQNPQQATGPMAQTIPSVPDAPSGGGGGGHGGQSELPESMDIKDEGQHGGAVSKDTGQEEDEEEEERAGGSEADADTDEDHDEDDGSASETEGEGGSYCGYADPDSIETSYRKQPPRFPIPKIKTLTMYELSHTNHLPMRIFQIYRKYMLLDPTANPGAKDGFYRHVTATADEQYKFKRGFLLFYIYRNMWRTAHGIRYKNLTKSFGVDVGIAAPGSDMERIKNEAGKGGKDAEDSDATEEKKKTWSQEDPLLHFLRNLPRQDIGYLACVFKIILRMTELLAREMEWKDTPQPHRLIDTVFESETASGYTSLTRVLDQFHNGRTRRIHKLLQSVNTYYDALVPQFLFHLQKVWLEKGGTKETLAEQEAEAIWDRGEKNESLWVDGWTGGNRRRHNKWVWVGDLPEYYNDDYYQGDETLFI